MKIVNMCGTVLFILFSLLKLSLYIKSKTLTICIFFFHEHHWLYQLGPTVVLIHGLFINNELYEDLELS